MTFDEFIKKYLGQKIDFDGWYDGQCVDLYRQYVQDVLGFPQSPGVGGATEIWYAADPNNYEFIKYTSGATPGKGDIVVWNRNVGGGFGHVAIFVKGNASIFTSLDQNFPTLDEVTLTVHNYKNVIGWLHPKTGDAMEIENELFEKLVKNSTNWDEVWKYLELSGNPADGSAEDVIKVIGGYKSRITTLENEVVNLKTDVENCKEQVGRLKDELTIATETNKHLNIALNGATQSITKLQGLLDACGEAKGDLASECATKISLKNNEIGKLKSRISYLEKTKCEDLSFFDKIKLLFRR